MQNINDNRAGPFTVGRLMYMIVCVLHNPLATGVVSFSTADFLFCFITLKYRCLISHTIAALAVFACVLKAAPPHHSFSHFFQAVLSIVMLCPK